MASGGDKELRVADGRLLGPLETSPAILPWFFWVGTRNFPSFITTLGRFVPFLTIKFKRKKPGED